MAFASVWSLSVVQGEALNMIERLSVVQGESTSSAVNMIESVSVVQGEQST